MYLLDSNTCIRFLNGRAPNIRLRMVALPVMLIYVCSAGKGEMFSGAHRSTNPVRTLERQREFFEDFVSPPFDDQAAEVYGRIRAELEAAGTPIGSHDMQIAAIALANNLILVTHNTREFSRIAGLQLEDWEL